MFWAFPLLASVEDDAAKIIDQFYDLQFVQAQQSANRLEAIDPKSPAGSFYRSVAYYQRYLLEEPRDPRTFQLFLEASNLSYRKALRLMGSLPAMSHYYQGAALGFQARAFVTRGHYAAAIPRARKGAEHLTKALELDPSLIDADLGLGMYYYFLSRVPPAAKPFAYLMIGMWGDREKGLALLLRVAKEGHAARREAQSILSAIYGSQREQQWDLALPYLRELMNRYPHNPRYRLSAVYILERKGAWKEAAEMAAPDSDWLDMLDPMIRAQADAIARYRVAENRLFEGQTREAGRWLEGLAGQAASPTIKEWFALRWGNYWDAMGQRERAMSYYQSIHAKHPRKLADQFMATPFPSGPRDVMPNRWPLSSIPE